MKRKVVTCGLCLIAGCAASGQIASPDTRIGYNPTTTTTTDMDIPIQSSVQLEQSGSTRTDGDATTSTGGTVGTIGGDGDSVALWLAIAALGLLPMSYPMSRGLRRGWERWRGRGATGSTLALASASGGKTPKKEITIRMTEWGDHG